MRSSRNTTNQNSALRRNPRSDRLLRKIFIAFCCASLAGILSSCESTYPEKTLTSQLTQIAKDEEKTDVLCRIVGRTLWVYIPMADLVDEQKATWNSAGLEKMSKIISLSHRVLLSTNAGLDFLAVVGANVKKFGVELMSLEYVPDIHEAIMEKFSRGEFFLRSIRDVSFHAVDDEKGMGDATARFYDVSFGRFLALQIVHRMKHLFAKDKNLSRVFELKSTASKDESGLVTIEMEFLRKSYDVGPNEAGDPFEFAKMTAAAVARNYDYRGFKTIELTDTFSGRTQLLTPQALKATAIKLPDLKE